MFFSILLPCLHRYLTILMALALPCVLLWGQGRPFARWSLRWRKPGGMNGSVPLVRPQSFILPDGRAPWLKRMIIALGI